MDKLKEMFKGLPKWAWWVIGGGGILLLYFGLKSNSSPATTNYSLATPNTGSGTGSSNNDVIAALNTQLQNLSGIVNEQSKTYMEGLAEVQKSAAEAQKTTNETIANQNKSFSETIGSLTNSIKETNESTRNQLTDVLSYVDQSNKALSEQISYGTSSSRESVSALTSTVNSLLSSRDDERPVGGSVSTMPVSSTSQPVASVTPPKNYGVIAANTPATSEREAEIIRKAQAGQMPTSNLSEHEKQLVHENWKGRSGG